MGSNSEFGDTTDASSAIDVPLTRRRLLKRAGVGAAITAAGPLIAACGGSESSAASSTSTTSATAAAGGGSGVAKQLREILAVPTGKAAAQGVTVPVGASMALSGAVAIYGHMDYTGIKLAVKQIKELGGANLEVQARNNELAEAKKGVANAREWGGSGVPLVLSSGSATVFSELPYYAQFKMLALEPGGATKLGQDKPFFYQTRSEIPNDQLVGIAKYLKAKHPTLKRVVMAGLAYSPISDKLQEEAVKQTAASSGWDYVGSFFAPVTTTDFSSLISQIRSAKPDFVLSAVYGASQGVLLKQYSTSGLTAPMIGFDYTPEASKVAGPAIKGYQFAFDYFDAAKPPNEWAKLFVSEYEKAYGEPPTYYSANYYEATFLLWQLMRGIVAKGGDPTKQGNEYVKALEANLTFPSVYGSGAAHGTKELSASTHSLVRVPMVYCEVNAAGEVEVLATFNKGGGDFKLV